MAKRDLIDGMDSFTRAYVECALWSSTDESDESGGDPIDQNYSIEDLTVAALRTMIADCAAFQRDNEEDLYQCGLSDERAGHDFWLTRNRHGSGFWDECFGDKRMDRLTAASHAYGEAYLSVYRGREYHD